MQISSRMTALMAAAIAAVAGGTATSIATGATTVVALNKPADVAAVNAIEQDLLKINTMKDAIKYYAPDAVVYDAYSPGIFRGTRQIYDGFEKQFSMAASFKGEMRDMNILSDGNFACAAMQLHFDSVLKDGSKMSITMRQLDAFKKIGGKWLLVQQHMSFPRDPKTGMAVMNSSMPVRGALHWNPDSFKDAAVPVPQAKQEIRHWLDVGVLSKNLDELMSYYGPTDDLIVYDILFPPGEFRGMKEVRDGYASVMELTDPHVDILDFVVDSDGVYAVQIDAQDVTFTQKDGTKVNFLLRQSDCMRRMNGRWLSVLEEVSEPMDPKTGKSVVKAADIDWK